MTEPSSAALGAATTVVSSLPTPKISSARRRVVLGGVVAVALATGATFAIARDGGPSIRSFVAAANRPLTGDANAEHLGSDGAPTTTDASSGVPATPSAPPTDDSADAPPDAPWPDPNPSDEQAGDSTDDRTGAVPAAPEPAASPEAVDDAVDAATGVARIDVAANDEFEVSGPDGWTVTKVIDDEPNAVITIVDGLIEFVADPTFSGVDEFRYEACSAHGDSCAAATVTVDVTAPPRSAKFVSDVRPLELGGTAGDATSPVAPDSTAWVAVGPTRGDTPVAALLRVTVAQPARAGVVTITNPDTGPIAAVEVAEGEQHTSRLLRVPIGPSGRLDIGVGTGGVVTVQQLAVYLPAARSTDGRFVPVTEAVVGQLDTKTDGRVLRVDPSSHPEIPDNGVGFAVVRVDANIGPDGGQVVVGANSYTDSDQRMMWPGWGESHHAAGEMIVAVGDDGTFEFEYLGGTDITVTALGYITNDAAAVSAAGLFVPIAPAPADGFVAATRFTVEPVVHGDRIVGYHLT